MTKFRINIYLNNNNKCEMINIIYMNIYILQKKGYFNVSKNQNVFKSLKYI